jgi:hypothetical protein
VAAPKHLLRPVISALVIGASVLGLINVYEDNAAVRTDAHRIACPSAAEEAQPRAEPSCSLVRESRTPFGQSFLIQSPGGSVDVSCSRAWVLLGAWSCQKR